MSSRFYRSFTVAVTALTVAACGGDSSVPEAEASTQGPENLTRVINVETSTVERGRFDDYVRITGEVEALNDVVVAAEEFGIVSEILADKGDAVRAGQVVIRLNSDVLQAQVAEARAAADLAREQAERQRRLWEDERIGSEINYLQTRYQAEMADARLAQLRRRLENTEIEAPVDGVFEDHMVDVGEVAAVGAPVMRIVSAGRVKVTGGVPERYAADVHRGATAEVSFEVIQGRTFNGRISYVGSVVDPNNRTFPIEIEMPNPGGVVKPNMVADLRVPRASIEDVIVVPQQVVLRISSGYQVFVVEERNGELYASAREVTLGNSYNNRVVIRSGLAVGDRLITLGQQMVDDGSRVTIVSDAAVLAAEGAE